MRKNASKCTDLQVKFQKFSGGYAPKSPYRGGATAPLPRPHPLDAPALRASLGAFGLSIVPLTRNPGSTPERTHPLKILATPME